MYCNLKRLIGPIPYSFFDACKSRFSFKDICLVFFNDGNYFFPFFSKDKNKKKKNCCYNNNAFLSLIHVFKLHESFEYYLYGQTKTLRCENSEKIQDKCCCNNDLLFILH